MVAAHLWLPAPSVEETATEAEIDEANAREGPSARAAAAAAKRLGQRPVQEGGRLCLPGGGLCQHRRQRAKKCPHKKCGRHATPAPPRIIAAAAQQQHSPGDPVSNSRWGE